MSTNILPGAAEYSPESGASMPAYLRDAIRQHADALDEFAAECVSRGFITAGELAKRKDVSRSAVYQWARDGKIETYELGGRKFFLDGEVKNG